MLKEGGDLEERSRSRRCVAGVDRDLIRLPSSPRLPVEFEEHPEVRYGITAMCIGIGMGGTVIWENPNWSGAAK